MTKLKRQKFKVETAAKLLKVARDDFYTAELLSTAPKCRPETVLYHIQQCIEKSVKSVLISREQAVIFTHDIDLLLAELPESLVKDLPAGVGELTQYATIRRYLDGDELIENNDIIESLKVAKIYIDWSSRLVLK